ncbi:hypothetical protein GCM10022380_18830 [Amycolatopsis tucumanensis]|uniref:Uncharacterized protein n=1 Tax=Amycolatopsis tucumanensis TaxID=401106 RepID=A0ABP7HQ57_9PSEU
MAPRFGTYNEIAVLSDWGSDARWADKAAGYASLAAAALRVIRAAGVAIQSDARQRVARGIAVIGTAWAGKQRCAPGHAREIDGKRRRGG